MTHNDVAGYRETSKRELPKNLTGGNYSGKKTNIEAKVCKHLSTAGWCSKKHQRCPLLNLTFINL